MWLIPAVTALLLSMTSLFLFPLLLSIFRSFKRAHPKQLNIPKSIDVIIPCHNEQGRLKLTLQSIFQSITEMRTVAPHVQVNVICGLDCCNDASISDTQGFNCQIKSFDFRSKWLVICSLINESKADWIALVDCGVTWDRRFLRNVIAYLGIPEVVGFAPAYLPVKAGLISRIYWRLEAFIKSVENISGGPVSVHGATVLYRSSALRAALQVLSGRSWINDDVVLPLVIRALHPQGTIIYSSNQEMGFCAYDHAGRDPKIEKNARTRVSQGNLQWIGFLVPFLWIWNKGIFFSSLRRVVRLFWAVAPVLALFSLVLFLFETFQGNLLYLTVFTMIILGLVVRYLLRIPGFQASIKAFYSLLSGSLSRGEEVRWK